MRAAAFLVACAACAALLAGCADVREDLQAPVSPGISVHAAGWTDPSSPSFHGRAIASAGWDMRSCRSCHGADYDGGISAVTCATCHSNAGGPENCATCHGDANSPAPPADLAGNTGAGFAGVGAHAKHVLGGTLASKTWCSECHTVPGSVYDAGHVDSDLPAEVPMNGALARTVSNGISPSPTHDPVTLTCSNTYCHGNWQIRRAESGHAFVFRDSVMRGANASPSWTGGPSQAACGTCHITYQAAPPDTFFVPTGHIPFALTACVNCHDPVVDRQGRIADKSLHINGKINVFGGERSF